MQKLSNLKDDAFKVFFSQSMKRTKSKDMQAITETINNNKFVMKTNEQYEYWIHYINYVFKKFTDIPEKHKYYMKNFKEKIMIACLDVLS